MNPKDNSITRDQIQSRLLTWAAVFLFFYALAITLSPAARERSWDVNYRWGHWGGLILWALLFSLAHHQSRRLLPERDPYLLPLCALLTGWGLLTVWRLTSEFGYRQALWMLVSAGIFIIGMRLPDDLNFLRRYKYLWLTGGLLLTALTLILGTNPGGFGPRLWLGCCGVYFQPSEPLKLLLVVFLAAYFASRLPLRSRLWPLIYPTLFITGLALAILLAQRDLGTASIFIFLYAVMLYLASGKLRLLAGSFILLAAAGVLGYFLIDIVRLRLDVWLNPWDDPSGSAYQIIQSLLAIANGGLLGRGPGLGSPTLVPVAHSDFVYTAIAEESGLIGTIGLLASFGLLLVRGLIISLRAPDAFRRLLSAGLTAYLGVQAILIIGGNLRLLPLTGVTLPFISYGGSSLLTSFLALLILMIVSNRESNEAAPLINPTPYFALGLILLLGLFAASLANGWWSVYRSADLLTRSDNPRRAIADRYVRRGSLLDRNNLPIDQTEGAPRSYTRVYKYPALASVTGYTHPVWAQAGLEKGLDPYLRGLQGNPASLIAWEHLLYGTPPPGLDVRLSIDLRIQKKADDLLGTHTGVLILINAATGEILAMASHQTFDPNQLDAIGADLLTDPTTPLINRATQGQYPAPLEIFSIFNKDPQTLLTSLGFYSEPQIQMPVAPASPQGTLKKLRVSPLQIALAASALSNDGLMPAARIAMAINTPAQGWVILPPDHDPVRVFSAEEITAAMPGLHLVGERFWSSAQTFRGNQKPITWYLIGTLPGWQGAPLAAVVVLEEDNLAFAKYFGVSLIEFAVQP
jgi:cell division protein FtsW (lipid II flippase)